MGSAWKVLVTGDHESLLHTPVLVAGKPVEWKQVRVLEYERLPLNPETLEKVQQHPYEWIIFSSPRAVRFWTETLLEKGQDLPIETQVACIGESTAEAASQDGYTPDFYPTEPGSECFISEFSDMISNQPEKPTVLIVQAENGRTFLATELARLGCRVSSVFIYRSKARETISELPTQSLAECDAVVFTSPSSFDAFQKHFQIPPPTKVGAMGTFTQERLKKAGIASKLLPEGNFQNIGELLC